MSDIRESDKYLGKNCHTWLENVPYCPECGSFDVLEQGHDGHNHRHYCKTENVIYWLSRT